MTPKEKARELIDKFNEAEGDDYDYTEIYGERESCWRMSESLAKQCALIAVDEIISVAVKTANKDYEYWQEVKQEIENL